MRYSSLYLLVFLLFAGSDLTAGDGKNFVQSKFEPKAVPLKDGSKVVSKLRNRQSSRISKKSTGVALDKTAGSITADTLQVGKSSYDYGWNGPTRTWVSRDADGAIHVAYTNRLLLDNSDRQVTYAYIMDGAIDVRGNVTDVGDLAYMPTVRPFQDGRAAVSVSSRTTNPLGTFNFYIDIAPGFATFISKIGGGEDATPDASSHFAMGSNEIIWWASDSLIGVYSLDEGDTWVNSVSDVWDMTGTGGSWAGTGVETSADGGAVAYFQQFWGAPNADGDSVDAVWYYSVSTDTGATWERVPVMWVGADTGGVWDVFNSGAGTVDSLTDNTGPWLGTDLLFDNSGNIHMLIPTLGFSGDKNVAPLLHYSSARGEGAANLIELTDSDASHSQWFSDAIDSGYHAGNGFTFATHPTLATATDNPMLFAMWNQPSSANGTTADTVNGIWVTDVYGAYSIDGGNTWSTPVAITSTPNTGEAWTTLDPQLQRDGEGEYHWHGVWYDDSTPGVSLFGDSDSSNDNWIYATGIITTEFLEGPNLFVSTKAIDFNPTVVGHSDTMTFNISSIGTDTLIVSDITTSTSEFSAFPTAFSLLPAQTRKVNVVFSPVSGGAALDSLTITSNDSDDSVVVLSLSGEGVFPPIVSVTPSMIIDTVLIDDSSTVVLTISNSGGSDLTFFIEESESDPSQLVSSKSRFTETARLSQSSIQNSFSFLNVSKETLLQAKITKANNESTDQIKSKSDKSRLNDDTAASRNDAFLIATHNDMYSNNEIAGLMLGDIPWLEIDTADGVVSQGEDGTVTVKINTLGLELGDYLGYLSIKTNDPVTPQITVPVELNVMEIIGIIPEDVLPKDLALEQNYPNPFNPVTTISYALPKTTSYSLIIYDLMGRELMRWSESDAAPGFYNKLWNGTNKVGIHVSTGVYIYRLTAGDIVFTKKMILLK